MMSDIPPTVPLDFMDTGTLPPEDDDDEVVFLDEKKAPPRQTIKLSSKEAMDLLANYGAQQIIKDGGDRVGIIHLNNLDGLSPMAGKLQPLINVVSNSNDPRKPVLPVGSSGFSAKYITTSASKTPLQPQLPQHQLHPIMPSSNASCTVTSSTAGEEMPSSSKLGGPSLNGLLSKDKAKGGTNTNTYGRVKRSAPKTCCNEQCDRISKEIVTAPSHMLFYVGIVSTGTKRYKICKGCMNKAEEYIEKCIQAIMNDKCVYDIDVPLKTGTVTTIDLGESDSDPDEEKKKTVSVPEHFQAEVDKILESIGIDRIVAKCTKYLTEEYEQLEKDLKEISLSLQQTEKTLENNRKAYEKLTGPTCQITQLKPIDIDAFGNVQVLLTPPQSEERNGSRKKSRPPQRARRTPVSTKSAGVGADETEICELRAPPNLFPVVKRPILAATPAVLPRIMPKVGDKVFCMRSNTLNFWVRGEILDVYSIPQVEFKVKFELTKKGKPVTVAGCKDAVRQVKVMNPKHIAYNLACPFILPVATRIIALFHDEFDTEPVGNGNYYAGIVAEPPKAQNKFRYLIFFDDGYAQYVIPEEVFLVCESSNDVWNDVHKISQEFIKTYVKAYPERPMVRLQEGGEVVAELGGRWYQTRVLEVDGSLAKLYFEEEDKKEWIYRGSTRLSALFYKEKRQMEQKQNKTTARFGGKKSSKNIEYTYSVDEIRADGLNKTARKSTSGTSKFIQPSELGLDLEPTTVPPPPVILKEYEGIMKKVPVPKHILPPKQYVQHICNPSCVREFEENKPEYLTLNPLAIPMRLGFGREVGKSPRRTIFYRSPCGRRLKSCEEVHNFLIATNYNMDIGYFCFDFAVDCMNEFSPKWDLHKAADITNGKELVKVPWINSIDHDTPEYMEYTHERLHDIDVPLNLDQDFLACCDCVDDCLDKENCSCWKLTMEGINQCSLNLAGYDHKRLNNHVFTGIYECNAKCKCKKTCSNRVVQNPFRWQLQLFKTSTKGWGVRPLHDIPKGAFICVYTGKILTEDGANMDGKVKGDEYLAELDYIEATECSKEGYEEYVVEPEPKPKRSGRGRDSTRSDSDSESSGEEDSNANDKDFVKRVVCPQRSISTRSTESSGSKEEDAEATSAVVREEEFDNDVDDGKAQRKPSNFAANIVENTDINSSQGKKTTRELFGPDELCYILDAKGIGNIGRYLNHSCQPNCFVQNVFVDTHDIRFPWVAFFAKTNIRAGHELTWDYNYDIGSVPDKQMFCYCNTSACRVRLL